MTFLPSQHLQELVEQQSPIVEFEGSEQQLKRAQIELSLGAQYFVTGESHFDVPKKIEEKGLITIRPGQFGLLLTAESVNIPPDKIAFISIKAGIKLKGLVNISGFHVDPGFHGKLVFSVYNAGPNEIVLRRGDPYFIIWFANLSQEEIAPYDGAKKGQDSITPDLIQGLKGYVISPAALNERISRLELYNKLIIAVGSTLFVGLITMIVSELLSG